MLYSRIVGSYIFVNMKKQKIVIIGAGSAGLTSGYEILRRIKNYEVTILEESKGV